MERSLTLAIAGDVMLGRLVNDAIARRRAAYPWGDVLPALRRADLFLVNLECALTAHTERWRDRGEKAFYFRADPSVVETLKAGRVDFASLANNHAGDYGNDGMLETVRVLDGAGIAHAGAGANRAAARAPAVLASNGWRVSVVAYADHPSEWAATRAAPGISYTRITLRPEGFSDVESAVASARRDADVLIFSIHWGPNMRVRPSPAFREFARRVIDAGADIFWGHSAHVVQGIEFWHERLILYDTGDLIDDYAVDAELRNDLSALFFVRIGRTGMERVELLPVQIADMQVNVARGGERELFVRRLASLCGEMATDLVSAAGGETLVARPAGAREER